MFDVSTPNHDLVSLYVEVEVSLLPTCTVDPDFIKEETLNLLPAGGKYIIRDGPVDFVKNVPLSQSVKSINIVGVEDANPSGLSFWQADYWVHVYRLSEDGPEQEMIDGAGEDEEVSACDQWVLPSVSLEGVWESLILEEGVKNQLLNYATTALLFTDKGVSKNIISCNRVVLLHGPPGTGKTSLCKALAHKLSIRLGNRYSNGQLLEINAHSLFSKWFSESGKLVQRLFEHIWELADDEDSLVCVLVDEVESLTAARSAAMGGNEPSDAVRVVNAVLTQIDNLRQKDNVLVLTTSNVSEAIDLAFIDRADIKQYIGLPNALARYQILRSCLEELDRVGIIRGPFNLPYCRSHSLPTATELGLSSHSTPASPQASSDASEAHARIANANARVLEAGEGKNLVRIAELAEGLSGRALRKLPFQAHAFYVQRESCTLPEFLSAMAQAVEKELRDREDLAAQRR
ncbi:unnamed protein product [Ascophyllum nodosum]